MPGIFLAGPEKSHPVRKPGIYFHSPEVFQSLSIFLILGHFPTFRFKIGLKKANFWSEISFAGVKLGTFRTFCASARKKIFGKMVTLDYKPCFVNSYSTHSFTML